MANRETSGQGTRPTTDGTVENIGAGESLTASGNPAPAPRERMSGKRADADALDRDDSDVMGMKQKAKTVHDDRGNTEPYEPPTST